MYLNKKYNRILSIGLVAILTTGCATTGYKEPKTGKIARVRLATIDHTEGTFMNGGNNVKIRGYSTPDCGGEYKWTSLRNGPLVGSATKRLDMPLWNYHKNAAKEFFVPTSEPLLVMFTMLETERSPSNITTTYCGVLVDTDLEANKDYEFVFAQLSKNTCKVDMYGFKQAEDNFSKEKIKSFNNSMSSDRPGCMSAFTKERGFFD